MHANDDEALIQSLKVGGETKLAELCARYEDRLRRMVTFRMDRRLLGRVDDSDILQEAYLEAAKRIDDFLNHPAVPFFVWLRKLTAQVLINVHRRHLDAKMRDAGQEVRLRHNDYAFATSLSLAAHLVGNLTSPSRAAIREEALEQLRQALEEMDEIDREVLTLRHFEELTNNEVADTLGLQKSAASNRYIRALKRLKTVLSKIPGFAPD